MLVQQKIIHIPFRWRFYFFHHNDPNWFNFSSGHFFFSNLQSVDCYQTSLTFQFSSLAHNKLIQFLLSKRKKEPQTTENSSKFIFSSVKIDSSCFCLLSMKISWKSHTDNDQIFIVIFQFYEGIRSIRFKIKIKIKLESTRKLQLTLTQIDRYCCLSTFRDWPHLNWTVRTEKNSCAHVILNMC